MESGDMRSDESWLQSYGVTDCPGHQLEHSFSGGLLAYVVGIFQRHHEPAKVPVLMDGITTIFIAAILDQNLGIITTYIPTFQPLFQLLAATVRKVGYKLYSSRELSYRVLPKKVGRHNHRQEEAFNLRMLISRPILISDPPDRPEALID